MKDRRWFALPALLLVSALASVVAHSAAQDGAPKGKGGPPGGPAGNELVEALKNSPGCIGVETAFTQSRKTAIFAWFEDKEAVIKWYESDYHQTVMMGLREAAEAEGKAAISGETHAEKDASAGSYEDHVPLAHVPDDCGPILCIATITPGAKQLVPGFPAPIQQISIELYQPLPGGIAVNGKFAPASLKVPHMVEMPLQEPKAPAGTEKAGSAKSGGAQGG